MQENKNKVIIVGYSGHSYVLIESLIELGYKIHGYTEKKQKVNNPFNLKYLGDEKDPSFKFFSKDFSYVIGIGNNSLRTSISKFLRSNSCKIINVINCNSSISNNIILGSGIFIARNATINALCNIGNDVIINTSATIDHECVIDSGSHIGPGAVLLGNVKIKKKSFIGANTVIREGLTIGENVVVGAGSVVLKNVENNKLIYGNPAK